MDYNALFNRLFFLTIIFFFALSAVAQGKKITTTLNNIPKEAKNTTVKQKKNPQEYISRIEWLQALSNHIARYKYYPCQAKKNKETGEVKVKIQLDGDGTLVSTAIAKSSNMQLLDQTTIKIIEKASPYPKPPKKLLEKNMLSVTLPIIYTFTDDSDSQDSSINAHNSKTQILSNDTKNLLIAIFFIISIFANQ